MIGNVPVFETCEWLRCSCLGLDASRATSSRINIGQNLENAIGKLAKKEERHIR